MIDRLNLVAPTTLRSIDLLAERVRYTIYAPNVTHLLHIISFHIYGPLGNGNALDRFQSHYSLSAGPSNVYDGHHRYTYFIDENAVNASGTRQIHRLEMTLSKTAEDTVLSFEVSVKNLESHSFNGFVLVFIVEDGLIDPSYPTITWHSVFRDYGLNKTLSLTGSSTTTFQGTWNIQSGVNTDNLQVVAATYDADERDAAQGWPYAVQSVCDVCGHSVATSGFQPTDVNKDGKVNIIDITIVAKAFGSKPGDLNWNEAADMDKNGQINILDISRVAKDFGKTT